MPGKAVVCVKDVVLGHAFQLQPIHIVALQQRNQGAASQVCSNFRPGETLRTRSGSWGSGGINFETSPLLLVCRGCLRKAFNGPPPHLMETENGDTSGITEIEASMLAIAVVL